MSLNNEPTKALQSDLPISNNMLATSSLVPALAVSTLNTPAVQDALIKRVKEQVADPKCPLSIFEHTLISLTGSKLISQIFDMTVSLIRERVLLSLNSSSANLRISAIEALAPLAETDKAARDKLISHVNSYHERSLKMDIAAAHENDWFYDNSVLSALEALRPLLPDDIEVQKLISTVVQDGRWVPLIRIGLDMLGDIAPNNYSARRLLCEVATGWNFDGLSLNALKSLKGCLSDKQVVESLSKIVKTAHLPSLITVLDDPAGVPDTLQEKLIRRLLNTSGSGICRIDQQEPFATNFLSKVARAVCSCTQIDNARLCTALGAIFVAARGECELGSRAAIPETRPQIITALLADSPHRMRRSGLLLEALNYGGQFQPPLFTHYDLWSQALVECGYKMGEVALLSPELASLLILHVKASVCESICVCNNSRIPEGNWFPVAALGPLLMSGNKDVAELLRSCLTVPGEPTRNAYTMGALKALDYVFRTKQDHPLALALVGLISPPPNSPLAEI